MNEQELMRVKDLKDRLLAEAEQVELNVNDMVEKDNKSAGKRARQVLLNLDKTNKALRGSIMSARKSR